MRFLIYIIALGIFSLCLCCIGQVKAQTSINTSTKTAIASEKQVYADFYHVMYTYFEADYLGTLNKIEKSHKRHGFDALTSDDKDRLTLIKGAAQLNLGLHTKAQENFLSLLNKNSSQYVKANTWFWLARTGFENNQANMSVKAYEAVSSNGLESELSTAHWQSLIYMAAYTNMHNGEEWEPLLAQLENDSIYSSYLLANLAGRHFNSENYAAATQGFVAAKQALLQYQSQQQAFTRRAIGFTRSIGNAAAFYLSPWRWFSDDPNKHAQRRQNEARERQALHESDALFDRLNLQLAHSLLKQQDDVDALAVINTVSANSGDSQQALLTLGWTHAEQNRWQAAVDTWQYLRELGPGIFQLQASYGLAYAYQKQGLFVEAFYALEDTGVQISTTLDGLAQFEQDIGADNFFDDYESLWPQALLDIKRTFLTQNVAHVETDGSAQANDVNPHYLLNARRQLAAILTTLSNKAEQLEVLKGLLEEREQRFVGRVNGLSLEEKAAHIANTKLHLQDMQKRLNPTTELARQTLMLSMTSKIQQSAWQRLNNANARHARLTLNLPRNDPPHNKPLKPSYKKRLARIEGILKWQMEDSYVVKRWEHLRQLQAATEILMKAEQAYRRVSSIGATNDEFALTRVKIEILEKQIAQRRKQSSDLHQQVEHRLREHLLSIISLRTEQLKTQWVNTRLAKIRLQDLQGELLVPSTSSAGGSQ